MSHSDQSDMIKIPCALGSMELNFWARWEAEGLVIRDTNNAAIVTIGLDREGYFVIPWGIDVTPPKGTSYEESPRHGGCLAALIEGGEG